MSVNNKPNVPKKEAQNIKQSPQKKVVRREPSIKYFDPDIEITKKKYPYISEFCDVLKGSKKGAIGREQLIPSLEESLNRMLMRNAILLGPAGVGKTAFMEAYAYHMKSKGTLVLAVQLATMSGEGDYKFAERFARLNAEVLRLVDDRVRRGYKGDVVLFLDEMHLLTMGSSASMGGSNAGNAIKPLASRQHIRLVGATTDEEYQEYIKPDQALERRFVPLQLDEPDFNLCVTIIKGFVKDNAPKLADKIPESLYNEVVHYTNIYQPAFAQPAKALNMMDRLISRARVRKEMVSHEMLRELFLEISNVDIDFRSDIFRTREILLGRVKGQDEAIRKVENHLFTANAGLQDESGPVARFLFAGPTGVGKTELAKAIAEAMFGDENKMIRFDMSEYNLEEDTKVFQKRISAQIEKKPFSVVLLDELEKASRGIMNLCLGILDDGRLSNEYGRQTTFNNSIIIMTTNAGANIFKNLKEQALSLDDSEVLIREDLEKTFSPEFLGRFDELIAFQYLNESNFQMITKKNMDLLIDRVKRKHNVTLTYGKDVLIYLLYENFKALKDPSAGGGRAVGRRINRDVTPLVSRVIDYCYHKNYELQRVTLQTDGELRYYHKDLVKGLNATLTAAFTIKGEPDIVFEMYGDSLDVFQDSVAGFKKRVAEREQSNRAAYESSYKDAVTGQSLSYDEIPLFTE